MMFWIHFWDAMLFAFAAAVCLMAVFHDGH